MDNLNWQLTTGSLAKLDNFVFGSNHNKAQRFFHSENERNERNERSQRLEI